MMFGGDDNNKAASWKKKYYDSLEQLDRNEKTWQSLEKTLRNAMSRMSVALEGMDGDLDRQLEQLRQAVRQGEQSKKLNSSINSVIKTVERLERQRKTGRSSTPAEVLAQLLTGIRFPKGSARRVKALKKQLDECDGEAGLKQAAHEFSELIHESFKLLRAQDAPDAERPGLLGKFFGKEPHGGETPAATVTAAKGLDAVGIVHELINTLLEKVVVPQRRVQAIQEIKQELPSIHSLDEMHHLARKIAIQLSVFDEHQQPAQDDAAGAISLGEMMLQLLEKMAFPQELHPQVESIQGRLEAHIEAAEWPQILEQIAALVTTMREKAQQEKREVETFLTQLTGQLHELDNYVQSVESDQLDSSRSDQTIGDKLRDHVRNIENSMRDASDLEQLKGLVQQQMTTINRHMEHFLEDREKLNAKADQRIHELNSKLRALELESDALRNKVIEQRKLALLDALTGINNRLAYNERMAQEHARWKRYRSSLSLLMVDIDYFKKINDTYGHMAGDKVLKKIAVLLQDNIRETDFLARFGGEEFAIIMSETPAQDAHAVAEKLRQEVARCGFHYRNEHVTITISCGISEFAGDDTIDSAFTRADSALYQAKANGRNCCVTG